MKHTDISLILGSPESYFDKDVTVCGWIRTFRDGKNMAFMALNDGTSLQHLQIVVDKNSCSADLSALSTGASVAVKGVAVKSFNANQVVEVNASQVTLLGACPQDYPIQKTKTSLDFLRTLPHLRVRTNTFNAVFRIRSKLSAAIHEFFQQRGFLYVHTPIITGSDCEGAGEIFQVTTVGFDPSVKTQQEYDAKDFFGQRAGLTVSGQLEGEVMATAFGKIYTFGPTFRAENSNTTRHAAEFWQIEPEVAFAELPDIMEIATDFIKHIIASVLDGCLPFWKNFTNRDCAKSCVTWWTTTLPWWTTHRRWKYSKIAVRASSIPSIGARICKRSTSATSPTWCTSVPCLW